MKLEEYIQATETIIFAKKKPDETRINRLLGHKKAVLSTTLSF